MKAWTALYLDPYFASQIGPDGEKLTGRKLQLAQERFKTEHKQPTSEELADWVLGQYAPDQFTREELIKRSQSKGILSIEERFAPDPADEQAVMKDEFWQILHAIPPGELYREFLEEYKRQGGDPDFLSGWYDTNGMIVNVLKDPEKFAKELEALRDAADAADLRPLTVAELEEQVAAQDLNDEFKALVEQTFGAGFYEMRGSYYEMSFEERADWRKANPEAYALIKAYRGFRDQFAVDNPIWAKFYHREALEPGFVPGGKGGGGGSGGRGGRSGRLASPPSSASLQIGERSTWDASWLLDPRQVGKAGVTKGVRWPRRLLERGGPKLEEELDKLATDKKPLRPATIKFLKAMQERDPSLREWADIILTLNLRAGIVKPRPTRLGPR